MNKNSMDFAVILRIVGGGEVGREAQSLKAELDSIKAELVSIKTVSRDAAGGLDQVGGAARKAEKDLGGTAAASRQLETEATGAANAVRAETVALQGQASAAQAAATGQANVATQTRNNDQAQKQVTKTTGLTRAGFQQLGFQLGDVSMQWKLGTQAGVIFAQQSGQVIQALMMINQGLGQAQGTAGRFLSFMAGPWGIGIAIAVQVLAPLVSGLFSTEEASDGAGKSTYDFTTVLQTRSFTIKQFGDFIDELNAKTRSLIDTQALLVESLNQTADATITDLESRIAAIDGQMSAAQARINSRGFFSTMFGDGTRENMRDQSALGQLKANRQSLADQLSSARAAQTDARIAKAERDATEAVDTSRRLEGEYAREKAALIERRRRAARQEGVIPMGDEKIDRYSEAQLKADLIALERRVAAQKKALQDSRKSETARGELADFMMPVQGRVTEGLGWRGKHPVTGKRAYHGGLDIPAPTGTPVVAPQVGTIKAVGFDPVNGKYVTIDHGAGTVSKLIHLSDNSQVQQGQAVQKGQLIGKVGSTGRSTGPHAHWQTTVNGKQVDPRKGPLPIDSIKASEAAENYAQKLADFGIKAQDAIAGINSRFGEQPKIISEAEKATIDLDRLIAELTDKEPPNFEKLIADAQTAKSVIQDSLSRPIREMLADQERGIELQRLHSVGRDLEADQLEQQYKLMDMLGAEDANQLAAALAKIGVAKEQYQALFANLGVMRQISDEERKRSAIQQERLARLDDVRRSTEIFFEDLPSKGFGAVGNLFSDIYNQFKQSLAKQVHDQLLGGIFKEMEDEISGKTALREAEQAMHQTVVETTNAITALGNAAVGATGQLNGQTTIGLDAPDVEQAAQDIIVSGRRDFDVFGKLFTKLFQTFLGKDSELAGDVGKAVGGVLKGMVAGEAASSIAGQLGIKQSKTGAKIGSAVGAMAASAFGLPPEIGGAIGGFWGGTIGGLFKKTKSGGASLNFQNGVLGSSTFGNSRSMQDAASSAMTSVMDGLQNIASQLGGFIAGNPSVSIGQYKGKWRVNTTGGTRMKKGAGVTDFGKDGEEAARMFALQDALKDGLISGLSDNVRRALQSSKDINNALREAMQVDQIELLLGGFGTAARKEFVDFERQAKERLRIASKYGFDLVKLEEANQKERQKLLDNAIAQATGGLKDMLDDMLFGERAAGTLMDRRAELIKKRDELIPLAATDADAAAKLADILSQLYEVSIAAYGSAGAEFAGDRTSIQSTAEDIIAKATAELTAAQKTAMQNAGTATNSTDTLIGQGNQLLTNISGLLDEGNDLQARLLAALRGGGGSGASTFDSSVFNGSRNIGREVML